MGFVGWEAFIKSVDLEVIVIVVWAALEASLRKFDVLQCVNYISVLFNNNIVRHVDDTSS